MADSLVKRYQMLDFCGEDFYVFEKIHPERVFSLNEKLINDGDIIYLMTREMRIEDNWGLLFAFEKSRELYKKLKVILPLSLLKISERQKNFLQKFFLGLQKNFEQNKIHFEIINSDSDIKNYLKNAGMVVCDFDPVNNLSDIANEIESACLEVDSHNIIPARLEPFRQEFSAASFRPKIYRNVAEFLCEYPPAFNVEKGEAYYVLKDFIENKLSNYASWKNDPTKDYVSGLSKYLHFGLISAQRVTIEVIKSKASRENKESFLEELIVRKELSDNFCLHNKNFSSFYGASDWAKENFVSHRDDIRHYIYDLETFEAAQTHEELWNACQRQLLQEGSIHGYMRMYWAKKILEWSESAEEAVRIAVYLNDTYALDGNDSNGYVGILWAITGLHDRPFFEREVFGKIRYMNENGCRRKFDTAAYIKKYS